MRKTHEEYIKEVMELNPNIIVESEYINTHTKIWHRCKIDGYMWKTAPSNILSGCGCPVCGKKKIGDAPEYKNSIWASDFKSYLEQFLTEDQMKTYMPYSSKKIIATCPNCGTLKKTTPALLIRRGIKCQVCSDGISYPNKFGRSFIKQIKNVYNLKFEYSPEWLIINGNKCYFDIYFEYNNSKYIIEMDGNVGHGNFEYNMDNNEKYGKKQDLVKDNLAEKHNIKVIRIDSRISTLEYIKNNIINSELVNILGFNENDIDWNFCANNAVSSLAIKARDLWEEGHMIKDIATKLEVSTGTIKRYLKQLAEINACSYTPNKARKRAAKITNQNHEGRSVIYLKTNRIYKSIKEASIDNNLSYDLVRARCRRKKDFRYYDEYQLENES